MSSRLLFLMRSWNWIPMLII